MLLMKAPSLTAGHFAKACSEYAIGSIYSKCLKLDIADITAELIVG
jgi:hypothetical protein